MFRRAGRFAEKTWDRMAGYQVAAADASASGSHRAVMEDSGAFGRAAADAPGGGGVSVAGGAGEPGSIFHAGDGGGGGSGRDAEAHGSRAARRAEALPGASAGLAARGRREDCGAGRDARSDMDSGTFAGACVFIFAAAPV